jgi:hypothetical protein
MNPDLRPDLRTPTADSRRANRLSWLTTAFCILYVGWMAWHMGGWFEALQAMLAGAPKPLPVNARFVTSLSPGLLRAAGAVVVAGLIAKELCISRTGVRQAITFLVYMAVGWFAFFCFDAIYQPLFEIMRRIG